jgi:tRNA pseudouridine38-40 synthase
VRYSARVEYDGTDFEGFQTQVGRRTVQGELERALGRISASGRVKVDAAGRTDAGVHARGQLIAFSWPSAHDAGQLGRSLAALLPPDIAVGPLRRVPADFNPRYRALRREYRYSVWNGPASPLRERYALGVREPLDVAAMAAAAEVLTGRHDFSAFGGVGRQPIRTLERVRVRRRGALVTIEVVGDSFLRQMVRRLVAALIRVGRGQATAADVAAALRSRRPAFAGAVVPPQGLTLWRVTLGPGKSKGTDESRRDDDQDI